ncbi:acetyl-CoA synthetase-like protein [Hymenopellis radicata]|nr:acetyl-CoA synthetase-like protein [Hymenopellis radicata]
MNRAIQAAKLYPDADVLAVDMNPLPARPLPSNIRFQQLNVHSYREALMLFISRSASYSVTYPMDTRGWLLVDEIDFLHAFEGLEKAPGFDHVKRGQSPKGRVADKSEAGIHECRRRGDGLSQHHLSPQVATPGNASSGGTSASVKLLPSVIWKVIRADGSLAERGEKGGLWVKTPSMATGYRNNLESWSADGWLRSGDEVYLDDAGDLFVVQRLKGFRVDPDELESHLFKHVDVACCVVPVPDEFSGEVPKAFIVPRKHVVASDLMTATQLKAARIQHVAEHKVTYKHLGGGVAFCEQIPETASGKMLRRLLRDHKSTE